MTSTDWNTSVKLKNSIIAMSTCKLHNNSDTKTYKGTEIDCDVHVMLLIDRLRW